MTVRAERDGEAASIRIIDQGSGIAPELLRAIEMGRITPVGSDKEVEVDYRLIAATNRDLLQDVEQARFRRDLFYRLNVIAIEIAPVRERAEDILPLARHFLEQGQSGGKRLSRAAVRALVAYHWPGNVRELANAVEHVRLLCNTDVVLPEHLPPATREYSAAAPGEPVRTEPPSVKTLEESEIETIRQALEQTDGNRTRAAELLGITRRGLIYKLKRLEIG